MFDKFSSNEYFEKLNKYFRAVNYVSAAQLYLLDNPLLKTKLKAEDVKKKIVGHWGTVPGQNFIYTHCNRVINKYGLNMLLVSGPGHGGNFFVANSYLEGTYSEFYPEITQDKKGLQKLFKQFSFPGGIGSHATPEQPGSIHEGGELGYSLAHSFGAVFDNPNLIVTTIVGDGEAETGPLATAWHGNKFVNPKKDGAVLPVLHLNGYKISNPTVLSRISKDELVSRMFTKYTDFEINFEAKDCIKILENNESNRVKKIKIGNKELTGVEARKLFGLKSAKFSFEIVENEIIFFVIGYGHGVGLSQSGSDSLAKQGYDYISIIKHYYKDVQITE